MLCSVAFIAAQLLWYCSKLVRRYDILEIPMAVPFFPLAPFFDPHNGMVNSRHIFLYALAYWVPLYFVALGIARKKVNPAIPAAAILILSCVASVVYSVAGCASKDVVLKKSSNVVQLDGVTQDQQRSILELIESRFGAEMPAKVMSISYHDKNKRFNVFIEQTISKREHRLLGPRYLVVDPDITSVQWGPRD